MDDTVDNVWGSVGAIGDGRRMCTETTLLHRCLDGFCTAARTAPECDRCDRGARSFLERICSERPESALGPLPDACGEFLDVIEHFTPLGHLGQDLSLGVHDRGVVAAEGLADLGQ